MPKKTIAEGDDEEAHRLNREQAAVVSAAHTQIRNQARQEGVGVWFKYAGGRYRLNKDGTVQNLDRY